jgi:hypothetical protein
MSNAPHHHDLPPPYSLPDPAVARDRILFPAIFLLVVGVFNLSVALLLGLGGMAYKAVPPKQVEKMLAQERPEQWDELQRNGYTAQWVIDTIVRSFFTGSGLTGFVALLIVVGAVRMIQLRSYGLAVASSVLSSLPCISPSSCLMLGVFAGVWALVVLLDPDVREAFP